MASLTDSTIASTYPLLLKVSDTGFSGSLKTIEDGDGTSSALQLSTAGIKSEILLAIICYGIRLTMN